MEGRQFLTVALMLASLALGCSKDEPERREMLPPQFAQQQRDIDSEAAAREASEGSDDDPALEDDDPFGRSRPPAAPTMPESWKVTRDATFNATEIAPVAEKLKGEIAALRNTTYDVGGIEVKLNIIVARETWDADAITETLRGMKPAEFVIRNDNVVYEFVAKNDAIPEIRKVLASIPTSE